MIDFNDYKNHLLKVRLKDSDHEGPIYGIVGAIGGLQPASPGFKPNPHSCMFIQFADEKHALEDDYLNSDTTSLYADDIQSIEVIKENVL